jgi:hypothetical protein
MSGIFIGYHHKSEAIARTIAQDIKALGHTVWFDDELSGGQAWWDQILARIRDCDVFIFILTTASLNSTACNREYSYAADLGKPILPILVAEGVSPSLFPPRLSKIQFVDYRKQDRDSALRLARAFATVPPPESLPEPLPDPPEVPFTYLGSLTEKIGLKATLTYEEQSALVVDLKRSLRDPETTDDAHTLLGRLRKRRDLFASIAEEIDELLAGTFKVSSAKAESRDTHKVEDTIGKTPSGVEQRPQEIEITQLTTTQPTPPAHERLICALIGAVLGSAVGFLMVAMTDYFWWQDGILTGAGGAIAGAIGGKNRRVIVAALIGAVVGLTVTVIASDIEVAVFFGAILGATVGMIIGKLKKQSHSG